MKRTFSSIFLPGGLSLLCVLAGWSVGLGLAQEGGAAKGPEDLEQEVRFLAIQNVEGSGIVEDILKLASSYLDLGHGFYTGHEEKLAAFKEGARLAKKCLDLRENSARAHFLYAANLGSAAELEGLVSSVFIVEELQTHLNRVLELDEAYAPAHHMLGRMYEELPWFLGGNQKVAGEHLSQAVKHNPLYVPARLDWARWLLKQGKKDEALKQLEVVRDQPPLKEKQWLWERKYRPEALSLLHRISLGEESGPVTH